MADDTTRAGTREPRVIVPEVAVPAGAVERVERATLVAWQLLDDLAAIYVEVRPVIHGLNTNPDVGDGVYFEVADKTSYSALHDALTRLVGGCLAVLDAGEADVIWPGWADPSPGTVASVDTQDVGQ